MQGARVIWRSINSTPGGDDGDQDATLASPCLLEGGGKRKTAGSRHERLRDRGVLSGLTKGRQKRVGIERKEGGEGEGETVRWHEEFRLSARLSVRLDGLHS